MKRYRSPRHPMVATVPNVTATIGARTVGATSPSSQNRQRDPGLLLRANRDSEHGLAPPLPATPGQSTARDRCAVKEPRYGARSAGRRPDLDGAAARATILPASWQGRKECRPRSQKQPSGTTKWYNGASGPTNRRLRPKEKPR